MYNQAYFVICFEQKIAHCVSIRQLTREKCGSEVGVGFPLSSHPTPTHVSSGGGYGLGQVQPTHRLL